MNISLLQGLNRAAALYGDKVAVIDADGKRTWRQVKDGVGRRAATLRKLGVDDGQRVAILSSNSGMVLELFYSVLWAGGIIVPLNNRLSFEEMVHLVVQADPVLLFYGSEFAETATRVAALLPSIAVLPLDPAGSGDITVDPTKESAGCMQSVRAGNDTALLIFTGGTTGKPKGVMLTHANMTANSVNFIHQMRLDESVAHLHCGPLFHVASAARIFSVTQVGGSHVILPRFEAKIVTQTIREERVTIATFVPTMIRALLDLPDFKASMMSSLRYITYGAAPMPEKLLLELISRLPDVRLVQSYGMTETSPIATMLAAEDHNLGEGHTRLRSAGRPALLAEVAILDSDQNPVPSGTPGEVVVKGPMVMQGYWRDPEATQQAVRGGWMHTGDIGYLDNNGYLYVVDRLKDVIISGGENIYSQEVENAIASHPAVKSCAVIGRPDEKWGESVHAVVVTRPEAILTPQDLIAHCRKLLAGYKCPKSIDLRTSDLPLSGTNKVNKGLLRAELAAAPSRQELRP